MSARDRTRKRCLGCLTRVLLALCKTFFFLLLTITNGSISNAGTYWNDLLHSFSIRHRLYPRLISPPSMQYSGVVDGKCHESNLTWTRGQKTQLPGIQNFGVNYRIVSYSRNLWYGIESLEYRSVPYHSNTKAY
ncbi:hypothetical protein L873DRAFT_1104476 [Choiromyces venosus 120613-1]|uniref:Uncharacterized protein n=1 Tax=Choiromyces venosus 120613-1 TaxID=1336337 RepID=A0A3N4JHJ0_9PEZI|nr:hypothetical protein L873DRAFT_1104476 [Choiromyces venosus 120613-1]